MAAIDYTIPNQFKGLQVESPMNAMAQAMQLRNLQESSQMNALKRQEYQRAREEETAVRNWFASGKRLDSPEALNELNKIAPSLAPGIEKNLLERGKTQAETKYKLAQASREDFQTRKEQLEFTENALRNSSTPELAQYHIQQAIDRGYVTPDVGAQMIGSVPKDPNQFANWRTNLLTHSMTAKDQLERIEKQDDLAYAEYVRATVMKEERPVSKAEFLQQRNQPAAPAAAPTPEPAAAEAANVQGVKKEGEEGEFPGVELLNKNLIDESIAALLATNNPANIKIAEIMQKRLDAQELSGDFKGIATARKEIARIKQKPNPTPLDLALIKDLEAQIKATNEGRGVRVTATATTSPAGKSLAAPVGERVEKSLEKAEGAVGIMESANTIREALNTGNVIAGPLAGVRMKFAQVLELANAGDKQKLINTRTVIQGLATQTLESRAELRGQGQVTENEQKLLERARSGNIEDMTIAELQQIVNVSQRLANRLWSNHQTMLKTMETDPAAKDVIRYYYPTSKLPSAVSQSSPQDKVEKRTEKLDKIFGERN